MLLEGSVVSVACEVDTDVFLAVSVRHGAFVTTLQVECRRPITFHHHFLRSVHAVWRP